MKPTPSLFPSLSDFSAIISMFLDSCALLKPKLKMFTLSPISSSKTLANGATDV